MFGIRKDSVAVCILGMHRSGTSALARLLNLLGLDLGRRLLADAGADNEKGYWEQRDILACHHEMLAALNSYFDDFLPLPPGWEDRPQVAPYRARLCRVLRKEFSGKPLWGFKDPRTCRLLPLWKQVFAQRSVQPRFVLILRHPDEITASLVQRDGLSANHSYLLSLHHWLEAEWQTRGHARAVVTYDQMMTDWRQASARIGVALNLQWPRSADAAAGEVNRFLSPALRHHRAAPVRNDAPIADSPARQWALDAFHALAAATVGDAPCVDEPALDRIGREFQQARKVLSQWRPRKSCRTPEPAGGISPAESDRSARLDAEVRRLSFDNEESPHGEELPDHAASSSIPVE
jgi:hypothetical protein